MGRPPKIKDDIAFDFQTPDEIEQFLSELPEDSSKISLWRLNPQGTAAFIEEFDLADFDLPGIKNTYGGGKYKYIAKRDGAVARQGKFEIDGPAKGTRATTIKKYVPGVGLVYISKEQSDEIQSKLENEKLSPTHGVNDSTMTLLLAEIKALKESITTKPLDNEDAFLQRMLVMKQIFGQQSNPTQDFSKMAIDLIKQGMEVASTAENGGSPWMLVLDKVLPTIQDVLKVVSVQQARQVSPMPNQSSNGHHVIVPTAPQQLNGFDAVAQELQAYLPTFLRAASMGTDPEILVELALPQIPVEKYLSIIEWFESPQWFNDLQKLNPMIAGQMAWWQAFGSSLVEAMKNPQQIGEHEENLE